MKNERFSKKKFGLPTDSQTYLQSDTVNHREAPLLKTHLYKQTCFIFVGCVFTETMGAFTAGCSSRLWKTGFPFLEKTKTVLKTPYYCNSVIPLWMVKSAKYREQNCEIFKTAFVISFWFTESPRVQRQLVQEIFYRARF